MQCPNCGHENREIAQFCQFCGTALEHEPGPAEDQQSSAHTLIAVPDPEALPREEPETMPEIEPEVLLSEEPLAQDETEEVIEAEDVPEGDADEQGDASVAVPETDGPESPVEAEADLGEDFGEWVEISTADPETDQSEVETLSEAPHEMVDRQEDLSAAVTEAAETLSDEGALGEDQPVDSDVELGEEEWSLIEPLADDESEEGYVELDDLAVEPEAGEHDDPGTLEDMAEEDLLLWRSDDVALAPMPVGTIVGERYRVSEVLSVDSLESLYRVRDLRRCAQCGATANSPDEAFCVSCGAVMDQKPMATMLERPVDRVDDPVEAEVEDNWIENGRAYWVWREVAQTGPLGGSDVPMRMIVGQKTDVGQVRELDEDSMFVLTMSRTHESVEDTIALFVVADGMGGHAGGEVASKVAIQTLVDVLLENVFMPIMGDVVLLPEQIRSELSGAVEEANDEVYLERQKRRNDMGTTITAVLVMDWTLYVAHVGDCRAYRWSESGLEQLTTDHSIVASMVASGAAQPEDIYTHPQRSVIYRCVGDQPSVEVDTAVLPVTVGDRLVICCDGLWEMLRTEGIEDVMLREPDPQQAAEVMVDEANIAGGPDNISVIVVQL